MWKILLLFGITWSLGTVWGRECHQACPEVKSDYLNVHIVPHSHDDVGWLKTVEQYYYGANNSIQNAGVQYIYDSVLEALLKDPEKKFVSVEMEFFSHWWKEQDDHTRQQMRKVVKRGQLEFVGGGWCMNDEAAASYVDIIDQMTLGLKFLNDTFGPCSAPKAVWQIDPFGHSREQVSIFARMGFEYLFLGRIDYQDKRNRLNSTSMEMMWDVSDSLKDLDIFTGVLYNTYSPPPGFCFDVLCGDETIVDDVDSPMFNIDRRSKQLVAYILEQAKHFASNNIILTMGEDFHYQYAHAWFKNLDKLMKYINKMYASSKIRLMYSTPSCYGQAVRDALTEKAMPRKADDFFPYSSDPHAYWTGYFTSRPTFKGLVRQSSNLLQTCKQLQALSSAGPSRGQLFQFQRSQAIAQHHDAVTGTAKQHVSNDYTLRLHQGIEGCFDLLSDSYGKLLSMDSSFHSNPIKQEFCLMLNVSQCSVTERNSSFVVTLYNPLAFPSTHTVRLPVNEGTYTVTDSESAPVPCTLLPIQENVLRLPGRKSSATQELVFKATDLPPLGVRSYHIQPVARGQAVAIHPKLQVTDLPAKNNLVVSAYGRSLTFDHRTGHLIQIGDRKVQQELLYYPGMAGNNTRFEFRASGAYIFRPNGTTAIPVGPIVQLTTVRSPIVTEIYQRINEWSSQVFRLYPNEPDLVEAEWIIGPIPVEDDGIGKEFISRFTSPDIRNDGIFYTDSNGREMLERRVNYQPTYAVNVTEPISGNYYPVNSMAFIQDKNSGMRMTVLNDRAQGVSSIQPGSLEFMVHRRLLHDDAFGVGEPLNETAYGVGLAARGSHWLVLNGKSITRQLALRKAHPPVITFVPTKLSARKWRSTYRMKASLLTQTLPGNLNLLTLEPWDDAGRLLVRLEHFYAVGEDDIYSKPVTVSLKDLFGSLNISKVEEFNLAANRFIRQLDGPDWDVSLGPMEIRTLLISSKP